MGFLGTLIGGGKVDVEGSIAVQNRPADTSLVLSALFFPCDPGAGPLAEGLPEESLLASALVGESIATGNMRGDPGERFTARLPPGHYQVCVTALPFVLEANEATGGVRMVTDPNNRFGFWPLRTATHLQAGQKRVMSLKITFPKGLGRFGERTGTVSLLERIGPANRAGYLRAIQLARSGDLAGALQAYRQAFASPEVERLVPADAHELRLVLGLGQFKCLLDLGSPEDAERCRQQLFSVLLPKVRLSEADPATAWDFMSTVAIAAAKQHMAAPVLELLPEAIGFLKAQLATGDEGVMGMVHHTIAGCLAPFAKAQDWRTTFDVSEAALRGLEKLGPGHPLTAVPKAYQLEAYLASGSRAEAHHLSSNIGPEGRAVLLRVAQEQNLVRLAQALAPIPPGTARA